MIPETISNDAPPGEIAVFEALKSNPGTDSWTVLHSVSIARHRSQPEGEADFIVVIPHIGILVVEVKSHRSVSYDSSGYWRLGGDAPTTRSPMEQASGNMHSVRAFLNGRTDLLQFVPVWRAVWFTAIERAELVAIADRIDIRRDDLLGLEDLDAKQLPKALMRVLKHFATDHRAGLTYVDMFTPALATRVAEMLLPAVQVGDGSRIRQASERQRSIEEATEQQAMIIRMLEEVPRVIIDGGAGTGKTHVATRVARRAANRDQRVLLTMFNIYLEEHLREVMRGSEVEVRRIHAEMMRIAEVEPPADADKDWWGETLPKAALARMGDGFEPPYDMLVIDEAQDLVPELTLDVLDRLVVGGLQHGLVWAAGDFQRQGIHHRDVEADDSLREFFVRRMSGATPIRLDRNVRSTPELVAFIERLIDGEYAAEVVREDAPLQSAQLLRVADADEMDQTLPSVIEMLRQEGWQDSEILILSPYRMGSARRCSNPALAELLSDTNEVGSGIRFGTIHKFKGLEAPAVVLTDVSAATEADRNLLYVGATRATDRLVVLTADGGG